MKRILCLIVSAALALSLSACSAEEVSTTKSDELKAQYSFYEKSVKEIRGKMNVSPEQADEIFLVLVNDCGLDGAIRSIYTTDKGATYSYYWEGSGKTQKMTVENGVVTEVRYLYEVLYPSEDVDNSEDSSEMQEPSNDSIFDKIINSSDLPQYYGSLKEAKKFGKRFESGIVSLDGYLSFVQDKTVLSFEGTRSDKINNVEFYFKNADSSPSFEEAQKVMNMFLPFDIIDKYYDEPTQKMYYPNDNNESSYITTCYSLNDSGKGQDGLQGQIGLVYEMKNDICLHANIRFGLPRTLSESNGYFITEYPPNKSNDSTETSTTESAVTSEVESSAPSVPEATQTESTSTVTATPQSSSTTTLSTPQIKPSVVYIAASGNGTKYHKSPNCSKMNGNVIEMTREEAEAAGYTPCKKNSCYG